MIGVSGEYRDRESTGKEIRELEQICQRLIGLAYGLAYFLVISVEYCVVSTRFVPRNWHARRDSNPRHSVPKTDALSTELRAHV